MIELYYVLQLLGTNSNTTATPFFFFFFFCAIIIKTTFYNYQQRMDKMIFSESGSEIGITFCIYLLAVSLA